MKVHKFRYKGPANRPTSLASLDVIYWFTVSEKKKTFTAYFYHSRPDTKENLLALVDWMVSLRDIHASVVGHLIEFREPTVRWVQEGLTLERFKALGGFIDEITAHDMQNGLVWPIEDLECNATLKEQETDNA